MLLEVLCEISYPAGEAVSAGMIYIVGNSIGVGASLLVDTIMGMNNSFSSIISYSIIVGMIFFGNLFVFLSKSKLERSLQEHLSVTENIESNDKYSKIL